LLFVQILVLTVAALACHVVTTLYLMQILNRTFDPHWRPRMLFPPTSFRHRYQWTLYYSGAVLFKTYRRTVFENLPYDFSGQVSRTTRVVCVVHHLFGFLFVAGTLIVAVYLAWGLWTGWERVPRTAPKHAPYNESTLPELP
jgi:hypothetical protein